MAAWCEYGSSLDRLSAGSPRLAFAADGRSIVTTARTSYSSTSGPVLLDCVDVASGRVAHAGEVETACVAGGHVVASLPDGRVRVLRVPDLTEEVAYSLDDVAVAIAADDRTVAAAVAGDAPALVLVDRATTPSRRVALGDAPEKVAMSPDGRRVAVALANKAIAIVDVADAAVVATLKGARSSISGLAWSPAGDRVSAAAGKSILSWAIAGKAPKAATLRKGKQDLVLVGCTAQGLVVSTGYKEALAAVDGATGATVWSIPHYGPAAVAGDRVASVRFTELREVDAATGEVLRAIPVPSFMESIALRDGVLAVATRGARIHVVPADATTWPTPRGTGHDEQILDACPADGARFATTGFDGRVILWERGRSAPLLTLQPGDGTAETVFVDGDTLLTTFKYGVQRWRIADGTRVAATDGLLKTEVALVRPVPGHDLMLVATKASRGNYGALYLLAADTLTVVYEDNRIDRTYRRARFLDGTRVELTGDYQRIVFDVVTRTITQREDVRSDDYSRKPHLSHDGTVLVELDTRRFRGDAYETRLNARTVADGAALFAPVDMPQVVAAADLAADDRLVTPHEDGLRVWDIRTGSLRAHLVPPIAPYGACWCGDLLLAWDRAGTLVGTADS
jgi:WD40 repeat protein